MLRQEVIFAAREGMTPDFAAEISNCAARFQARVELQYGERRLRLGSLISILSLELRRGDELLVLADGSDEREAIAAMRSLLEGGESE